MRKAFFLFLTLLLIGCSSVNQYGGFLKDYEGKAANIIDGIGVRDSTSPPVETVETTPAFQSDQLLIGAFNIQVFGRTKANDLFVMDNLARIIPKYDIIAIQEIRDSTGEAPEALYQRLPNYYNYTISDRLGRTSSKEQYQVIYNPQKVELMYSYTFDDPNDVFEREPFVTRFKDKASGYDFAIMTIHVKPDDATREIEQLGLAAMKVTTDMQEPDIIMMGDFNADCSYYQGGELLDWYWIIKDDADTTATNTDCAYDRINIRSHMTRFVKGSGVDRYDVDLELNQEEAKRISDHYPVFALFDFRE